MQVKVWRRPTCIYGTDAEFLNEIKAINNPKNHQSNISVQLNSICSCNFRERLASRKLMDSDNDITVAIEDDYATQVSNVKIEICLFLKKKSCIYVCHSFFIKTILNRFYNSAFLV
jgi:hypothetical protein